MLNAFVPSFLFTLTVVFAHVSTPMMAQTDVLPLTSDQHPSRLCMLRALAKQPQSDLVLEVPLGGAGHPLNVPRLRSPEHPDANARIDYLIISAAVESCVPFTDVAEDSPLILSVTRDGGLTLAGQQKEPTGQLAALPVLPSTQKPGTEIEPVSPETLGEGSRETEAAMALDKPAIRDLQARLLTLGHDPNGIDGNLGRGTRAAIRDWQQAQGVAPTGYLNPAQHAHLKAASQPGLTAWLQDPENALLHNPPPPIPIGAHNMLGNWRYSANCGSGSKMPGTKITGVLNMQDLGGGRYAGSLKNSQGLNGRVTAKLSGRTVSGTTNFGLFFGKVNFRGQVDDAELIMRGRDSNGCSFYSVKR